MTLTVRFRTCSMLVSSRVFLCCEPGELMQGSLCGTYDKLHPEVDDEHILSCMRRIKSDICELVNELTAMCM